MKVSVIVPCRNERAYIGAFLENLAAQKTGDLDWDAWIADGESTDGTRQQIEEFARRDSRIHLIANPAGRAAAGLNQALAHSSGEIVIRMDVHTRYAEDYIAQSVAALERSGAENAGGPWRAAGGSYIQRAIAAAFQSRFCAGGAKSHDVDWEGFVDTVYLGCWRRETFARIGGFDESLERNQDDEWNLRLTLAGGKVWQDPHIRSWYTVRPSLRALWKQYFDYGFWKVAVIRKHGRPASWRHLAPGLFLLANVVLFPLKPVIAVSMDAPYIAATIAFSVAAAARSGWTLVPVLPPVFAVYHFAYGLGFLWGCIRAIR
jgi:glycosyltransferase involved in cell wall biosynthesis